MNERTQLIARKEAVLARKTQLRSELNRERLRGSQGARRARQIETQLEQLEAEEHELRLSIDRAGADAAGADAAPTTPA